jgi:hypothetical protein
MALRTFEKLDAKFEKFLTDVLHQVDEKEFTPELKAARRAKADADDLEFCRIYYPQIFDTPFNDMHRYIAEIKSGNHLITAFPTSGKTAFTFITKVVKPIAQGVGGLINIGMRTQDVSKERSAHVYRMIRDNRLLMYDYVIKFQQEQKGHYIINHTELISTSVETGLRNYVDQDFKRFKISINDDMFNRVSVRSDVDNENVADYIKGESWRQMEPDGLNILLYNRINENCPGVKLEEEFPDRTYVFPIIDEKGKSNWPERFPDKTLTDLEADTPYDVWVSEWLCEPFESGDIFKPEWLRGVNINTLKIFASITAADPAHGTSPTACNKGLATVGITDKLEVVVLDLYLRKEGYPEFFSYIYYLSKIIPSWKVLYFENDFSQWGFAKPYYQDWIEKHGRIIPMILHNSKDLKTEFRASDKESRIMNLVHPHQTGSIIYNERLMSTPDYQKYSKEYFAFGGTSKKLDGLDALATAYIKIFEHFRTGTFKSSKSRKRPKIKIGNWSFG